MISKLTQRLVQSNRSIIHKRLYHDSYFVAGPPKRGLTTGEIFGMGFVFVATILGPSLYIAANMQEYNGKAQARREAAAQQ